MEAKTARQVLFLCVLRSSPPIVFVTRRARPGMADDRSHRMIEVSTNTVQNRKACPAYMRRRHSADLRYEKFPKAAQFYFAISNILSLGATS